MGLKDKTLTTSGSHTVDFEFPRSEFVVSVAPLSREERQAIFERCKVPGPPIPGFRKREEELDEKRYYREYAAEAIKGWRGLDEKTLIKLLTLKPDVEITPEDLAYSQENAEVLLSQSVVFKLWIDQIEDDSEAFNKALRKNSQTG